MTKKRQKTLMIFALDRLTDLLNKGEMTDRYYNPGDLFENVHIVLCNDDQPDLEKLQKAVGTANLTVHNLIFPKKLFLKTIGYQDIFLNPLKDKLLAIVDDIQPQLIRCHGTHLHTYLCTMIKKARDIPYLVSMHINPDEDIFNREKSIPRRLQNIFLRHKIIKGLRNASLVMPVYSPIADFLDGNNIRNYKICYNVLNPSHIHPKTDYSIHSPVKIVSVGRQIEEKDCSEIIHAVAQLPDTTYTLIGNGPIHQNLKTLADDLQVTDRVTFYRRYRMTNCVRCCPNLISLQHIRIIGKYQNQSSKPC